MIQIQEILEMSVDDRIFMIEQIWNSLDHDKILTPNIHKQELDRRLDRYEKGETSFVSWNDIKQELSDAK
jgi:putative addiction module component (TIGR02574 family)